MTLNFGSGRTPGLTLSAASSYSPPRRRKPNRDNPFLPNLFGLEDKIEDITPDVIGSTIGGTGLLLKNLGKDVTTTAAGLPRGLLEVGKALGGDTLRGMGMLSGSYKSDDLARAILDDYKHTYSPLAEGDFKTFGKRVLDHPLGPILDVLGLVTLGGTVAGKAGVTAAKGGSKLGAKAAGLERVRVPEGKTADSFLDLEDSGLRRGRRGAKLDGVEDEVLLPRKRTIKGDGAEAEIGRVPVNPVKRAEQAAYDRLSEVLPNVPIIGANRRATRVQNRELRSGERRGVYYAGAADKLIGGLEKQAKKGDVDAEIALGSVRSEAEGYDPLARSEQLDREATILEKGDEAVIDVVGKAMGSLSRQAARKKWHPTYVKRVAGERAAAARQAAAESRQKLKGAKKQLAALLEKAAKDELTDKTRTKVQVKQAGPINAIPENVPVRTKTGEEVTRTAEDQIAAAEARIAKLQQRIKNHTALENAYRKAVRDGKLQQDLAVHRGKAVKDDKGQILLQAKAKANLERGVAWQNAAGGSKYTPVVNQIVELLRAQSDENLSAGMEVGKLSADSPARAVSVTQQIVHGADHEVDTEGRFPIPQAAERTNKELRRVEARAGAKNATIPGSMKERSGYNTQFGLEALSPRNAVWAAKAAQGFLRGKRAWQTILAAKRTLPPGEPVPKGWVRVAPDAMGKLAENFRKFVDDEAPILFGDSPQLTQAQALAGDMMEMAAGDTIVPKVIHKRLLKELQPAKRIPLIDSSTGVWRTFTLSLRPAFYVNNIVGQTAMLLVAHSPYKMLKTRMKFMADPEAMEAALSKAGGIIGTGQAASLGRQTDELLSPATWGGKAANKALKGSAKLNDVLSRFGQAITDDPFRRLAFLTEVRGPAEAIVKARHAAGDVEFTFRQGVEEVLSDPKALDRIERKVLDDLVDFEDLSPGEREVVRRALSPFWSWVKGSSRMTSLYVAEHPARAALYSRVAQEGYEQNEEDYGGPVPGFLGGSIPIGGGKSIVTQGLNPFQTPGDLLQQGLGLVGKSASGGDVGPENPLSGVPPWLKAALAAGGMRQDPFTGQRIPGESGLGRALHTYFASFPQVRAVERLGKVGQPADRFLMPPSVGSEAFKYIGVPVRDVNRKKAVQIGKSPRRYESLQIPSKPGEGRVSVINGRYYYTSEYIPKEQ